MSELEPKLEMFCVEKAGGATDEAAYFTAGIPFHTPAQAGELGGQRRSRIARQTIQRLDLRIELLEKLNDGADREARLRNLRAIGELRWCRELLRNGGTEPPEWAEDGESGAESASPSV